MKAIRTSFNKKTTSLIACAVGALLGLMPGTHAANYSGNLNTGFGGPVGNGVLSVTDDHTNITVNLQRGSSGNLNDVLVIYIDTGTGTATNTAGFTDTGGTEQRAISGFDGGNRSLLTFTNGFRPSYAVAIKPDFMDVWSLANPASFSFLAGAGQGGSGSGNFTLTFNCAKLGLATNVPANFKLFGTYISGGGYRSTEAIAGGIVTPFGQGYNPFTNTAYATYNFAPAVIPTYAVKFSVDLSAQVALGNFVAGTDLVYAGGSFQSNAFAFGDFPLVQVGSSAIYTNTYLVADPTNTVETYKFKFHSVANNTDSYDSDPNRSFTLKSGGQVVPLVYFDNVPASPSATTNIIKFSIDLGPQIYLGHFNPGAGDLITVYGSFEQPHWSGNFDPTLVLNHLTNNPSLNNSGSNIYSGTFVDGNYPGTVTQYKFVIQPSGTGTIYEDGSDRSLVTPTNSGTLPVAYFNGVSTYAAVPITFSVDMTVPIAAGQLDAANGDTVGCAGTFQTNSFGVGANGFTLTNNPTLSGTASNIYSGTYIDRNAPGSGERYKFVINPGGAGTTIYEQPASTGGGDRQFLLGSVAITNPLVLWGDRSPNDVVLVSTTITFHVSMTNAMDRWGVAFDPDNDRVMVDGNFVQPAFPVMSDFADPNIEIVFPNNLMNRDTAQGLSYSLSFVIPAGSPVQVDYKYGILRSAGSLNNTNIDNEADFAQNHTRYIRTTATGGTYDFPLDIFGLQRTDSAGAIEPLFGKLAIGGISGGNFPISWIGIRGVHLQSRTNLVSGTWQDVSNTDGGSSSSQPKTTGSQFFRLVKP